MIKLTTITPDIRLFDSLVSGQRTATQQIKHLKGIPLEQKDILIRTIAQNSDPSNPELAAGFAKMMDLLMEGKLPEAFAEIKKLLPHEAAMKETSLGTAIMAKGWEKPIIFPHSGEFKWLGFADDTSAITTKGLWESAYGEEPGLVVGAVGNSNIKPEQVRGGCSMTKKELSAKYEQAIQDFFAPVFKYLKSLGVKSDDIGFAFAHSDCGVDKAARAVVEEHGLKGIATTPTDYTQYLRAATEVPPSAEFPNGAVIADFPFPTVLTRDVDQINAYADTYRELIGKGNPVGVFGGGEHAFVRDTREMLINKNGSNCIPVDIMKDKFGIVIPSTNEDGVVTNAARNVLEKVNGSPYERFKYAFDSFLPENEIKSDIRQYDPQMAFTTNAYARLAQAGKIPQ